MKKFLIILGLVLGFASAVYADGHFCCGGGKTKEECCAERGKVYCENENVCRTRCRGVVIDKTASSFCGGGCINPEGVCCTWCPSAEVCTRMGKCQKIVNGCYDCVECPVPNPCPAPQCMNEDGVCCDSCPRTCPDGQCLINVDGCYQCRKCGNDDDDTETTTECTPKEVCVNDADCCGGTCSEGICYQCACTEIDLYTCGTGKYSRTICCDNTIYVCDEMEGCLPGSIWTAIDNNSCPEGGLRITDNWMAYETDTETETEAE